MKTYSIWDHIEMTKSVENAKKKKWFFNHFQVWVRRFELPAS